MDSRSVGITPTYVGKSRNLKIKAGDSLDHPHVCGEKLEGEKFWKMAIGSPPRMWGKEALPLILRIKIRITPTYVGKS